MLTLRKRKNDSEKIVAEAEGRGGTSIAAMDPENKTQATENYSQRFSYWDFSCQVLGLLGTSGLFIRSNSS